MPDYPMTTFGDASKRVQVPDRTVDAVPGGDPWVLIEHDTPQYRFTCVHKWLDDATANMLDTFLRDNPTNITLTYRDGLQYLVIVDEGLWTKDPLKGGPYWQMDVHLIGRML